MVLLVACSSADPTGEPIDQGILPPGSFAEIARDDVTIHRTAGDAVVVNHVFTGERLYVVSEPIILDGQAWIRVQIGDSFGWLMVELTIEEAPIVAVEPFCPADPFGRVLTVKEIADLTLAERLHCFGGRTITIEPVVSRQLPSDIPYGGSPAWLADEPSLQLHGRGGFLSADGPLGAHIDSASDLTLTENEWYAIEGRFDDLAALTCQRRIIADELGIVDLEGFVSQIPPVIPEDAVLWCREQFVITAVRPIAPPGVVAEPAPDPAGGSWRRIPEAPIVGRSSHGVAWTGREMIVWGGLASRGPDANYEFFAANDGAAYDPLADSWRTLAASPLDGRVQPIVAWTGDEVLVLGGSNGQFQPLSDGAAYDPMADRWRATAPMPDSVTAGYASTWTGTELVVLSADGSNASAYDPTSDSWRELPDPPLPDDLYSVGSTWTGDAMIVVAYPNGVSVLAAAVSYDPESNGWHALPESPVVALNALVDPIWTGEEILVVSRSLSTGLPDGVPPDTTYVALFDAIDASWRIAGVQTVYQPVGPGVWMSDRLLSGDAVYDPAADAWLAPPQHPPRELESPIWTGTEVLYWGGGPGGDALIRLNDGLAYRPSDD